VVGGARRLRSGGSRRMAHDDCCDARRLSCCGCLQHVEVKLESYARMLWRARPPLNDLKAALIGDWRRNAVVQCRACDEKCDEHGCHMLEA